MAAPIEAEKYPIILTIAGFDPSSGAGVTADIKTIAAHGCFGVGCITSITVQNTTGVTRVERISGHVVSETLKSLASDMPIAAIRIGMLGSASTAAAVADFLGEMGRVPIVLDPVLRSSSGAELFHKSGIEVLKARLLPLALVITPNLAEAAELTGLRVVSLAEIKVAAAALQRMGARNVVVTGGHLAANIDLVRLESGEEHEVAGPRIESKSTHGTGCAFATALACNLAKGMNVVAASMAAKKYVTEAIKAAYAVGKGNGPINHFFERK